MLDLTRELNPRLVKTLACPVCGSAMGITPDGRSLACLGDESPTGKRHLFDGASGGYVHLAPAHGGGGDSKEAVRARSSFLQAGYYAPAATALADLVDEITPRGGIVLDAGCGEGYYTNTVADRGYLAMGFDLSKFAVDAAAKAARAKRIETGKASSTLYAAGSVFELPVQKFSVNTVINVFAPCAPLEFSRVLDPFGFLITVAAGPRHLMGLKELIYDLPYLNDERQDLPAIESGLEAVTVRRCDFTITVDDPAHIQALFSMTPYYWRTSRDGHKRLATVDRLETDVSFRFCVYRRR